MRWTAILIVGLFIFLCAPGSSYADAERVESLRSQLLEENRDLSNLRRRGTDTERVTELVEIGTPKVVDVLLEYLMAPRSQRVAKQLALAGLGKIGTQKAIEAVKKWESWRVELSANPPPFEFGEIDHAMDHYRSYDLKPLATCVDDTGRTWAMFRWQQLSLKAGRISFWLTTSVDGGPWADPLYASVPGRVPQSGNHTLACGSSTLQLGLALNLKLSKILTDTDGDGLTNALEHEYGTSPDKADTDGDSVPDGDDRNPMTPRHIASDDIHEIRQAVFATLFNTSNSRHAIVMVEDATDKGEMADFTRQEYYGYLGHILKSRRIRDGFVNIRRLEVVFDSENSATATIHDYEGNAAASEHEAVLKKTKGKWVITEFRMTGVA